MRFPRFPSASSLSFRTSAKPNGTDISTTTSDGQLETSVVRSPWLSRTVRLALWFSVRPDAEANGADNSTITSDGQLETCTQFLPGRPRCCSSVFLSSTSSLRSQISSPLNSQRHQCLAATRTLQRLPFQARNALVSLPKTNYDSNLTCFRVLRLCRKTSSSKRTLDYVCI